MVLGLEPVKAVGDHILPGIACLVISAVLLIIWETRRLIYRQAGPHRPWLIPSLAIALSIVSFILMIIRFLAVD